MNPDFSISDILRQSGLPAVPEIYFSLEAETARQSPSVASVASLIEQDATLRAHFLQLVRSPLFQEYSRFDDVSSAVHLMGAGQARDLVLAILMVNAFRHVGPDIVSREAFWRHSVACGVASRALATLRKEINVERFFVAGLLHDVGSLLIYMSISEKALLAILHGRDVSNLLYELENEVIGFDHAQLGGAVLQALKLPDWLHEAVSRHHAPELALNFPIEAAIVHVADIVVNAMKFGTRGEYKVPPLAAAAWDRIGLTDKVLGEVMHKVDHQADSVIKCLMAAYSS